MSAEYPVDPLREAAKDASKYLRIVAGQDPRPAPYALGLAESIDAALAAAPRPEGLDELRRLSRAASPMWDHDTGSGRVRYVNAVFGGDDEEQAAANAAFAVAAVKYVRSRLSATTGPDAVS